MKQKSRKSLTTLKREFQSFRHSGVGGNPSSIHDRSSSYCKPASHSQRQQPQPLHSVRSGAASPATAGGDDSDSACSVSTSTSTPAWGVNNNNSNNNSNKTSANRIPPRLVDQCLLDLFGTLLQEPCVIIIEDAHEMDESSWNVFLSFTEIKARAVIVLLQKPPGQLGPTANANAAKAVSSVAGTRNQTIAR
jgi:hypothetical protein